MLHLHKNWWGQIKSFEQHLLIGFDHVHLFDNSQNVFNWNIYIFPKIVKIFIEAPTTIMKLTIIYFEFLEKFNLGSKIGIGLTQI